MTDKLKIKLKINEIIIKNKLEAKLENLSSKENQYIAIINSNINYDEFFTQIDEKIKFIYTSSKAINKLKKIPSVTEVIMIASCKGGVGKTTVSCALAASLKYAGFKVGILDADICGPSIPTMFEITNEKPELRNNMMQPIVKNNIQLNSIGFIAQKSDAISMRGPMISKAIDQLFLKTNWLELDYLIIDTPPGTNDVHLQIMQNYKINDIILVTQNSKLALADNIRTITFYKNFNMDIMCIVENEIFMNNNKDEIIPGYKTHKISPLKEFAHFNITDITNVEIYYQNLKNLVNQIIAKK